MYGKTQKYPRHLPRAFQQERLRLCLSEAKNQSSSYCCLTGAILDCLCLK